MFSQFLKDHEDVNICDNVAETIDTLKRIYNVQIENLKTIGQRSMAAYALTTVTYPLLSINLNGKFYSSPISNPQLFENYYMEECLKVNSIEGKNSCEARFAVSKSKHPVPLALVDEDLAYALTQEQMAFRKINILSIEAVEEENAVSECPTNPLFDDKGLDAKELECVQHPILWFHPTRIDYSINRLKHYTGLMANNLQDYIVFVNYQKYLPYFVEYAKEEIAKGNFVDLIGPDNSSLVANKMQAPASWNDSVTLPQMPAYSLVLPNRQGITLVNIGVGASNAKTMADHLSVLRPKYAMMVGHCGGLKAEHAIGDYIVGDNHLMIDFDNVHRDSISLATCYNEFGHHLVTDKKCYVGPVVSVCDRNWELTATRVHQSVKDFGAVGIDMESAMLVKVFEQHGVPAGSFLCISDRPFHREIRLQKMAQNFYASKLEDHLMDALNIMRMFIMKQDLASFVFSEGGPLFR